MEKDEIKLLFSMPILANRNRKQLLSALLFVSDGSILLE